MCSSDLQAGLWCVGRVECGESCRRGRAELPCDISTETPTNAQTHCTCVVNTHSDRYPQRASWTWIVDENESREGREVMWYCSTVIYFGRARW